MGTRQIQKRCDWCGDTDEVYIRYHDTEWGVPIVDDTKLFEFITLESAQAGLSWRTILGRREGYRVAFRGFDPEKVARMTGKDVLRLMKDPAIIRNRLKIEATITNAKAFLKVEKEFGSFARYLWSYTKGKQITNIWNNGALPAMTGLSIMIAKDLKKREFSFLGPTTIYAFMQAVGLVNDHAAFCYRHREIAKKYGKKRILKV